MRTLLVGLALALGFGVAGAQSLSEADIDSLSRSAATIMADQINRSVAGLQGAGVTVNDSIFNEALICGLRGQDTGFNIVEAGKFIEKIMSRLYEEYVAKQKAFLTEMAAVKGAKTYPSGIIIITEKAGSGPNPTAEQRVKLNYVGRLSDGKEFDNTNGEAVTFKVSDLVPGFTEGLLNMQAGGTYRLIIPAEKAYGSRGAGGGVIPGDSALDFTITMLSIEQ